MELWLLHVSTPAKYAHFENTNDCSSYAAQPVPDPREAARRTLSMYFRYSWPLLGHFFTITPMNIIKADVHTCTVTMLELQQR
jgi:hypothetical protein